MSSAERLEKVSRPQQPRGERGFPETWAWAGSAESSRFPRWAPPTTHRSKRRFSLRRAVGGAAPRGVPETATARGQTVTAAPTAPLSASPARRGLLHLTWSFLSEAAPTRVRLPLFILPAARAAGCFSCRSGREREGDRTRKEGSGEKRDGDDGGGDGGGVGRGGGRNFQEKEFPSVKRSVVGEGRRKTLSLSSTRRRTEARCHGRRVGIRLLKGI